MNIELIPAASSDRPTLENLLQLYIHDFSEHWAGTPNGELDSTGRFAAYPLDPYWLDPTYQPLLIHVDQHLAGFALLNAHSHVGETIDHNVAEFFIVRKHRRSGVGRRVIHRVFDQHPGEWEIAVARRNVAALAFWRSAVRSHLQAQRIEERDVQSPHWNGPLLRFRIDAQYST